MSYTFDNRLKNLVAAFLFSGFVAGGISALMGPVTADKAVVVTSQVNRANKGDRLRMPPIVQPTHRNSSSEKPIARHSPLYCEPAFSPIADPRQVHMLRYCLA
jgi:hypothetical protein